jgi:hypothetical protein
VNERAADFSIDTKGGHREPVDRIKNILLSPRTE